MSDPLAELLDREAIRDVLHRYCRAVDRCDDDLLRSVYHPDAYDDHGAYQGGVEGFVAWVKEAVQARFRCTDHRLGNVFIELEGDIAFVETCAMGHHVATVDGRDVSDLEIGLRYVDRFERRGGEWRIARRVVLYEWRSEKPLDQLQESWTHGRHDTSDPVYLAPQR